jgi:hypothetical protein
MLGLGMGMALPGCGGGGDLLTPTNVVVFQLETQFADLERFHVFATDFTVPASGELRITVDWTFPSDDLDLSLSNPACDATALAAGICKVFATEKSNLKPAQLTMPTTATAYRLFVFNRGPQSESGTINVTVTQTRLAL